MPPGVSPAQAAVATDAVTTAFHAIHRRAEVTPSETVFLFGLGGLGFNALQLLLNIGCRVLVSDLREPLLAEAVALGVPERDIVPVNKTVQQFAQESKLTFKIDTILDFAGTHQTFEDSQEIGELIKSSMQTKLTCVSSSRRQDYLRRKPGQRKHHQDEDWHKEKTQLHILVRRSSSRS